MSTTTTNKKQVKKTEDKTTLELFTQPKAKVQPKKSAITKESKEAASLKESNKDNGGGNGSLAVSQAPTVPAEELVSQEPEPTPKEPIAENQLQPKIQMRQTAQTLATKQREISISEFFTKNRHLLGFDNPAKVLLTAVKEAVDNSLDACEEAGIPPEIRVIIEEISESRFRVIAEDNGPGIIKTQVPKIFAKLLYGSKFHSLKQARGQQGIGISAAVMYSQLTTGKPTAITSKTGARFPAYFCRLKIDSTKNKPIISEEKHLDEWHKEHGTRIEMELEASYKRGKQSVESYLELTALANPHARISYLPPKGETRIFSAVTSTLPPEAKEIKPHPYGVELGMLIKMLETSSSKNVAQFMKHDFSRVSDKIAREICERAQISPDLRLRAITDVVAERLYKAISETKIMAPPTNCLSPIGEEHLSAALQERVKADFYTAVTRAPKVYRGNPFQVEVGLAYGGELEADSLATLVRFANRVPLIYQPGACAITRAVNEINWRNYHIQQSRGALPSGPLYIMAHISSVWVPFTSESKEAIAHYEEIIDEFKLAFQEVGRRLALHLSRERRFAEENKKRSYIEKYIPHLGEALQEIIGIKDAEKERVVTTLKDMLYRSRSGLKEPEEEKGDFALSKE